jgi:hypothetical protein
MINSSLDGSLLKKGPERIKDRVGTLCAWLVGGIIVMPKVPLLRMGSGVIRSEDLVLLAGLAFLRRGSTSLGYGPIARAFRAWIAVQLAALVVAVVSGYVSPATGLLFAVRPWEYSLVFGLARRSSKTELERVFGLTVIFNLLLAVAQSLAIVGNFSDFNTTRAVGLTNGPYELAALTAGLLFWALWRGRSWLVIASGFTLVLSGSRVTAGAVILIFISLGFRSLVSKGGRLGVLILPLLLVMPFAILGLGPFGAITDRVVFSPGLTISKAVSLARVNEPIRSQSEYFARTYSGNNAPSLSVEIGVDASGQIRFFRWATLVRGVMAGLATFFLGFGPGFAGLAVDGNYMRSFVEGGLIGLFFFSRFVWTAILKTSSFVRQYALALAMTAGLIDIFESIKPMILLWVFIAMADGIDHRQSGNGCNKSCE